MASAEDTDQGADGRFRHVATARGPAVEPSSDSTWDPRVVSGLYPSLFDFVWDASSQVIVLRLLERVGGDEETRTPDPLLAKEMLCQLSYVPIGAKWWAFLDSNQRPLPYQGSALTS